MLVEARAPIELLRTRLAARRTGASVSDAREDLLDAFARDYEPPADGEAGARVAVDTAGAADDAAVAALRGLRGLGILPAVERRRG